MEEKHLKFRLVEENFWTKRPAFIKVNPMGTVPLLVIDGYGVLSHSNVITQYLDTVYPEVNFSKFDDLFLELDVQHSCYWFDEKFYNEVLKHILYEKVINFLSHQSQCDYEIIKLAKRNMKFHFDYMQYKLEKHRWIAADVFTIADITAASHISVLDYISEIDWASCPLVIKDWYSVVKSRPSFRPILEDAINGLYPPAHYKLLDFV